jgi:hypothetical protein
MTVLLIQVLLIVGVAAVAVRLLTSSGPRSQAVRRIGLLLFAALAIFSILVPQSWSALAALVGVGRGTDLILYALVVAFLSFTASTYLRHRRLEANLTLLARRIALDEAGAPNSGSSEGDGDATQ